MKLLLSLAAMLLVTVSYSQLFYPKLVDEDLSFEEITVVKTTGDTIRGQVRGFTGGSAGITRMTVIVGGEKVRLELADIQSFSGVPDVFAEMSNVALMPAIKSIQNDAFVEVLPEDGRVFFEKMRLPTKKEKYRLLQLLNPGYDGKVKVYAHPQATSTGETSINGLTMEGNLDNQHFVSTDGESVFKIDNWSYKKRALSELYNNCSALSGEKLKWKDFATHVFTYDQWCE